MSVSVTGDWGSPSNGIYQKNVFSVAGRNIPTTNGEQYQTCSRQEPLQRDFVCVSSVDDWTLNANKCR